LARSASGFPKEREKGLSNYTGFENPVNGFIKASGTTTHNCCYKNGE
jgi:hypothetical protein